MRSIKALWVILSLVGACLVLVWSYVRKSNGSMNYGPESESAHVLVNSIGKEIFAWEAGYNRSIYKAISAIREIDSSRERLELLDKLSQQMLAVRIQDLSLEARVGMAFEFWDSYRPVAYAQLKEDETGGRFESFLKRYWDLFYMLCHVNVIGTIAADDNLPDNIKLTYERKLVSEYLCEKRQFESVELRRMSTFASLSPMRKGAILRCWHEIKKSIDEREMADTTEVKN